MSGNEIAELEQEVNRLKKINSSLSERVSYIDSDVDSNFISTGRHKAFDSSGSVMSMLNQLLKSPFSDRDGHMVSTASNSATSLLTVINDILDYSKIQSEHKILREEAFSLRNLLDAVIEKIKDSAHKKNLKLITNLPDNIEYEVIGDAVRLRQIIENILTNAIKFTDKGAIKFCTDINIIGQVMHIEISVRDTGKGIDPAFQANIFEPFEQECSSNTEKNICGTGLGLSITRDLLKLMGGGITLHSTPGEGSTFNFNVKLNTGNKLDCTPNTDDVRILLAEDTLANQEIMYEQMDILGYKIEIVENGQQALEAINQNTYTLIFMDVHMPYMDGFAATKAIRNFEKEQNRQPVPIIAVTADVSQDVQAQCERVGMNTYLAKPFSITDIETTLNTWLGNTAINLPAEASPALNPSEALNLSVIEQLRSMGENCGNNTLGNAVNHLNLAYTILFTLQNSRNANALWHHQQLLEAAEHTAQVSHWSWESNKQHLHFSQHLQRYFNHSLSDIKTLDEFIDTIGDHNMDAAIKSCLNNGQDASWEQEVGNASTGNPRYLLHRFRIVTSADKSPLLIGTVQEITSIRRAERRITELAFYDSLTKLSSRSSFNSQLQDLIISSHHRAEKFAVIYLDLDEFKNINDSFGHDVGDELLLEVANRLRSVLRESDFASRLGGDEFCLLINDIREKISAENVARRCLELLAQPIILSGREIVTHASIGIAIYPNDGDDANILIKAADTAMYEAKKTGKKQFVFYEAAMTDAAHHRLTIENDLRAALNENQFELYYQPKLSLATGKVQSVEALIRWNHPDGKLRSPDMFIADAERIGLISELGEWVVNEACQQIKRWHKQDLTDFPVAVNISPQHFEENNFAKSIARIVQNASIPASLIEIEITESTSRNQTIFLKTCQELRELGFRTAIDDFGTGYSSLSVLKGASVDVLKIDREFIRYLPDDTQASILIGTIIGMSKALGMEVVAEGIETEEQLKVLLSMGCHMAQGYYFSKPVKAKEIPALTKFCFRSERIN